MAKFRFIGQHTGGRDSISMSGVHFVGAKASEVTDAEAIRRLRQNVEFEEVGGAAAKETAGPNKAPPSEPKPVPLDLTTPLPDPEPSEPERARQADSEVRAMRADDDQPPSPAPPEPSEPERARQANAEAHTTPVPLVPDKSKK